MPSSANRKRLEVPDYLHARLVEIAAEEQRTVASVVQEIITLGLSQYQSHILTPTDANGYTEHARHSLDLARDAALSFNHHYVGTEHLLLGLLQVPDGVATRALLPLGVDFDKAHAAVQYYVGRGVGRPPRALPLIPRTRRVLKLARDEARRAGSPAVDTGHLLLALLEVGDGMGARILAHLGIVDEGRNDLLAAVRAAVSPERTAGSPPATTTGQAAAPR